MRARLCARRLPRPSSDGSRLSMDAASRSVVSLLTPCSVAPSRRRRVPACRSGACGRAVPGRGSRSAGEVRFGERVVERVERFLVVRWSARWAWRRSGAARVACSKVVERDDRVRPAMASGRVPAGRTAARKCGPPPHISCGALEVLGVALRIPGPRASRGRGVHAGGLGAPPSWSESHRRYTVAPVRRGADRGVPGDGETACGIGPDSPRENVGRRPTFPAAFGSCGVRKWNVPPRISGQAIVRRAGRTGPRPAREFRRRRAGAAGWVRRQRPGR